MNVFWPIFVLKLASLGLLLTILGWKGRRRDHHPTCRKCGFDLVGSPQPHKLCPECGHLLFTKRGIRTGNRQHRSFPLAAGSALLLFSIMLGVSSYVHLADANVYEHLPYFVLHRLALNTESSLAPDAAEELRRRIARNQLSTSRAEQLLNDVLELQVDESRPWLGEWGDLIWTIGQRNVGSTKQYEIYFDRLFQIEVSSSQKPLPSDEIFIHLTTRAQSRGQGDRFRYMLYFNFSHIRIGDLTFVASTVYPTYGVNTDPPDNVHLTQLPLADLIKTPEKDGRAWPRAHKLRVEIRADVIAMGANGRLPFRKELNGQLILDEAFEAIRVVAPPEDGNATRTDHDVNS